MRLHRFPDITQHDSIEILDRWEEESETRFYVSFGRKAAERERLLDENELVD